MFAGRENNNIPSTVTGTKSVHSSHLRSVARPSSLKLTSYKIFFYIMCWRATISQTNSICFDSRHLFPATALLFYAARLLFSFQNGYCQKRIRLKMHECCSQALHLATLTSLEWLQCQIGSPVAVHNNTAHAMPSPLGDTHDETYQPSANLDPTTKATRLKFNWANRFKPHWWESQWGEYQISNPDNKGERQLQQTE